MEPRIGQAIKEGFRTASRSWPCIGLFVLGWGLLLGVVGLSFATTNPPAELLQGSTVSEAPATVPTVAAPVPAATTAPTESATQRVERVIGAWFGRAWPILAVLALLFIAGSTWLNGGQIGYLAKRVTAGHATLSEFWTAASRAFGALLGASLLSLAGMGVLACVGVLGLGLIGSQQIALVVIGILLALAMVAAVVWIGVRLSFWFIAIVWGRQGPLAALKASFQATRGRWWLVFWLACVAGLIGYGAVLPFALLAFLGRLAGGAAETTLTLIGNVAGALASLFVGFAILASYIRFYEDTKSGQPTS